MKKKEEMKRGDHIYVKTKLPTVSHHGIYCGGGHVIHFDGHTKKIVKSSVDAFSNPFKVSQIKVFNYKPGISVGYAVPANLLPFNLSDVDTVMTRAESLLGKSEYDLGRRNCEHFAVWCKTGRWTSSQIEIKIQAFIVPMR